MTAGKLKIDGAARKPASLLGVYRTAFEKASRSDDPDVKISAYGQVVNFCGESRSCRIDESIKRNRVMYWSFNNLGDAFILKNRENNGTAREQNYQLAIAYYREALNLARDDAEKINSLKKIAEVYKCLEDAESLSRTEEDIVESLGDEYKRQGYVSLAASREDQGEKSEWLEKALEYVTKEEVSFLTKCRNTLAIGEMLADSYRSRRDGANVRRIRKLMENTAVLAIKALEDKLAGETRRGRQLEVYGEIVETAEKFCLQNKDFRQDILRKVCAGLDDSEVIYADGTALSKSILRRISGLSHKKT